MNIKGVIRSIIFSLRKIMLVKPHNTIVHVDGGIASQMNQYMIGYDMKRQGRNVLYDITWYEENGKDIDGIFVRNFDLLKLFPDLPFPTVDKKNYRKYRRYAPFSPIGDQVRIGLTSNKIPSEPVLMLGYYFTDKATYGLYPQIFKIELEKIVDFSEGSRKIARMIMADDHSVGVHIRRGDMTTTENIWVVLDADYFINAICQYDTDKYTFYFFSEELSWVKKNVIKSFDRLKYMLVNENDSAHGYCDLALLSLCRHQICSQGSFGGVASMLNTNPQKILTLPKIDGGYKYGLNSCRWEDICGAEIRYADIGKKTKIRGE